MKDVQTHSVIYCEFQTIEKLKQRKQTRRMVLKVRVMVNLGEEATEPGRGHWRTSQSLAIFHVLSWVYVYGYVHFVIICWAVHLWSCSFSVWMYYFNNKVYFLKNGPTSKSMIEYQIYKQGVLYKLAIIGNKMGKAVGEEILLTQKPLLRDTVPVRISPLSIYSRCLPLT